MSHPPPPGGDASPDEGKQKEFVRLRARIRAKVIEKNFRLFTKDWPLELQEQCTLNRQLVVVLSESYFKDLDRKKEFHGIDKADVHKCAGYMAKWIMRFRPVQLQTEQAGAKVLLANEFLALTMAFMFLKIDAKRVPSELFKTMLYALRYRHNDGNAWAMSFYLLQQAFANPRGTNGHS